MGWEQAKEHLRKLEEEKDSLQMELNRCSSHLESATNKYNNSQKVIQELNTEVSRPHPQRRGPTEFASALLSHAEALSTHLCLLMGGRWLQTLGLGLGGWSFFLK